MTALKRKLFPALLGLLFLFAAAFTAAACADRTHTLRFMNGGTQLAAIEAEEGDAISPPSDPERDGLTFEGWSLNEGGDIVALPDKMPGADATYYAQWSALLTLSAGEGGTIENVHHRVRVGASLQIFLAQNEPQNIQAGLKFAGWYLNDAPLGSGAVMPAEALSLTAKYTAEYTLALYRQNVDGSYPETPERTAEEAFFGENLQYVCEDPHFSLDPDYADGRIPSLGAGQTLTVHLRRNAYHIFFMDNLPSEHTQSLPFLTVLYGGSAETADGVDFRVPERYRFAGWASSAEGDPEYSAHETIENVDRDFYLFARWDVAYSDRFGGSDFLFLLNWEPGKAILRRTAMTEKVGTYEENEFVFPESGLKGRVSEADRSFAFFREARAKEYTLYNVFTEGLEPDTLVLDGYFGATYTYTRNGTETTETGTYSIDPATRLYTFVSDGGAFTFYLGTWLYHEENRDIFAKLGEEAGYGPVPRCAMVDFDYYGAYSGYDAYFDGMGSVSISSMGTFSYRPGSEEGEFEILYGGTVLLRMLLVPFSSGYGWIAYDSELAGEYHAERGDGLLVLDGYGMRAEYDGGVSMWLYVGTSDLNGKILVESETHAFLLDPEAHTFLLAEQTFEEYYWLDANGGDDRYLVLYADMTAEIYNGTQKIAEGTFVLNGDDSYTLTLDGTADLPAKFTFRTDVRLDEERYEYLNVYWITEEWDEAGTLTVHYTEYTDENGNRLRDYGNGHADFLTAGGVYSSYSYSVEEELSYFHVRYITFRYYDGGSIHALYFHIGEGNTLRTATSVPTSYVFANDKHERITRGDLLWVDGIDRALYFAPGVSYMGTYSVYSRFTEVDNDITVYQFTPDDETAEGFRFIIVSIDRLQHILRYNEEKAGKFVSEEGTYLLDGYAFEAVCTLNGVRSFGQYFFLSDDMIRFIDAETYETRTARLSLSDRTFRAADDFYGDFFSYENYEVGEDVLRIDGFGGVLFGRFTYDYFGEVTGFTRRGEGSYKVEDEDYGILEVTLSYADGRAEETFRILLMAVDGGYYDYDVYVRAFDETRTYVSDDWQVLRLDGFGFATYIDAEGYVYEDAQYEMKGEDELIFIVDGYAHETKLQGASFRVTDVYFNPVLIAVYGDSSYLTTGTGEVYVRLWQTDEGGTLAAEITGTMSDGSFLSYDGRHLTELPRLPFRMTYDSEGGQIGATITVEYELDGYIAVLEYRLFSTFLNVMVVQNASYYWTRPVDWEKDGCTVRAYRYVNGSGNNGVQGKVMRFELLVGGELLPESGQGITADGGRYVMVPEGDHAGYYVVTFTVSGGAETGVASVVKHNVLTVRGEESLSDGTVLTVNAYYALVEGTPCGLHLTYTQSDFSNGQIYDLETVQTEELSEDVYYIYATYTYSDGAGVSEFHYVLSLHDVPSIVECQSGYVYSAGDEYTLYVLISYTDLYVYDFADFYVGRQRTELLSSERKEDGSGWYLYTGTEKFSVSFREEDGLIVADVAVESSEQTAVLQTEEGGKNYKVVYALAFGAQTPYAIRSLSVDGEELPCVLQSKEGTLFRYAVTEGSNAGYYEISFALDGSGAATSFTVKKYEVKSTEYTYTYYVGEYSSSTLFTCYYAMDGNELKDVLLTTYRVGLTSAYTYAFDPYLTLKEAGEGRYWLTYLVDSTYYHLLLDVGKESLTLCYYSFTYDTNDYVFMVLYDMTTGELYALGDVMADNEIRHTVTSAVEGEDGVWTVTTDSKRYRVKFTYNGEQQTYSAQVLSSEDLA